MTFCEFFNQYVISRPNATGPKIHLPSMDGSYRNPVFVQRRDVAKKSICRIGMIAFNSGELWYQRKIMLQMPVRSFEDARTIDGITYPTFQHAALAAGIVHNGEEALFHFHNSRLFDNTNF